MAGSVVEHREDVIYVTVVDSRAFTVWLIDPHTCVRTLVEHVNDA